MRHTADVTFNSTNLNNLPGVSIVSYDVTLLPSRALTKSKVARANFSVLTSAEYSDKTITVTGYVGGDTFEDTMENYGKLRGFVQDTEAVLKVRYGGEDVEWIATLNGLSSTPVGPNFKFVLTFLCSNPIGKSISVNDLFPSTNITTSSKIITFNVEGSFYAKPLFTITLTDITDGTDKSINIVDSVTNRGIRITNDFADGDIISIDSDTFQVVKNAAPIDFSGEFPKFLPGIRSIQYVDDFTDRDITLDATYRKTYI